MASIPELGPLVRNLRTAADLTLEGLAERSGVSARSLSDIERGVSAPQVRTVNAIADGLRLEGAERGRLLRAARAARAARDNPLSARASAVAPHRIPDFVGRQSEVATIVSLLSGTDPHAVVLVHGPPGTGKTTVALEALSRVHDEFDSTVLFVDLDGFGASPRSPLEVVQSLLRQMPSVGEAIPTDLDAAAILWRTTTAEHPVVVQLDNAASEAQVRPVLTLDSQCRVVVTSRRSLAGLEGARRIMLAPLGTEDGVEFLSQIIPEEQRSTGDLEELALLADHLPLALRIAGNRIASRPHSTVGDFVTRLRSEGSRLRLLVAGDLAIEAAFGLSYADLDPETARLFRAISVIDGATFDARLAAATLGSDVPETEGRLDELVDLGLLEARGGSRYHLHDLVRLFAAERLAEDTSADLGQRPRDLLRGWLLTSLERAGAWFEPDRSPEQQREGGAAFPDAATAKAWIRLEEPHWWVAYRSAAQLGENETLTDVADALHWYSELWLDWGHWTELFRLAAEAATALRDPRLEAMHLGYLVWSIIVEAGGTEEPHRVAVRAVAAAELSGDSTQLGWSHFYLGWTLWRLERQRDSRAELLLALGHFSGAGDDTGAAEVLAVLGMLEMDAEAAEITLAGLLDILDRTEDVGSDHQRLVHTLASLDTYDAVVRCYLLLDRATEALAAADSAVELAIEFEPTIRLASALRRRAQVLTVRGEFEAAERDIDEGIMRLGPNPIGGWAKRQLERLGEARVELNAARAGNEPPS